MFQIRAWILKKINNNSDLCLRCWTELVWVGRVEVVVAAKQRHGDQSVLRRDRGLRQPQHPVLANLHQLRLQAEVVEQDLGE